ncbi:MAG: hypothetical protein ABW009_14525 [Acidimicrobiales bacterium]
MAYEETIVRGGGEASGWARLQRDELKAMGPLGTTMWPAWPRHLALWVDR